MDDGKIIKRLNELKNSYNNLSNFSNPKNISKKILKSNYRNIQRKKYKRFGIYLFLVLVIMMYLYIFFLIIQILSAVI
ncbi:hypothetical protein LIT32_25550 (plasmid) [Bacillus sp. CMF21]|uniref:hypothetical protein n=1 Tax=Metabacillus dongyingensis TaxID=2874282 RepID=UPI001FB35BF1|nr:hypothetical protein [Metabacillus dongyingensis]UNJ81425.1 hypothetical protein [Metabacillus dongyingensis]USK31448.1 hypothetical protein LIT32_25550 [Bacillus sp. CMF21]